MYAILVMQLGYPPDYVLDKMSMAEARVAIEYSHYAHKDDWESARIISYLIAQVNSRKRLRPEDILPLSWDKKTDDESKPMTAEDIKRLEERAKKYKELFLDNGK